MCNLKEAINTVETYIKNLKPLAGEDETLDFLSVSRTGMLVLRFSDYQGERWQEIPFDLADDVQAAKKWMKEHGNAQTH